MSDSSNAKKTLPDLMQGRIFEIPGYQRGYAWEPRQVKDLIEDLNALVDEENVKTHYMGTVVIYEHPNETVLYKGDNYKLVDIVDGQQRLTSVLLYLSVILNKLGEVDDVYKDKISDYLYYKAEPRLRLGGDERLFYYELLKNGGGTTGAQTDLDTPQKVRLAEAAELFSHSVSAMKADRLLKLYDAITRRLAFTFYSIEEESEIGMTFELMNSRGKDLSKLELLKNYLMYWIYRNVGDKETRKELTDTVNNSWKEVYHQIGKSNKADDEQCLRICWTLMCSHQIKQWKGYAGFKDPGYVPIRGFSEKRREEIIKFISAFSTLLAKAAKQYVLVLKPNPNSAIAGEFEWITNILHTGNVANFQPLLVAAKLRLIQGAISPEDYVAILKAVECYAYRVFLWRGSRSNAGKSSFYGWGKMLFDGALLASEVVKRIYGLIRWYDSPAESLEKLQKPYAWYYRLPLLRYTLFEYEKHLLEVKGHGRPRIAWEDTAAESTHEHIFPQTPKTDSQWLKDWPNQDEIDAWRHDIGNLMLTMDNSSYSNHEFVDKCDRDDGKPCYRGSELAQEREIFDGYHNGLYKSWACQQVKDRHVKITEWIKTRWFDAVEIGAGAQTIQANDEDDEENDQNQ